jgi:stage III sporulation protein SpoIIIAA
LNETIAADLQSPVDEVDLLLQVLPPAMQAAVREATQNSALVEIVMDLGRYPEARTVAGQQVFDQLEVSQEDLEHVVSRVGAFGDDNRAGIERTLHRISAIRNRAGHVIGLTLRAGRAVFGTADLVRDVIEAGKSVLLVGRPGVGKTTLLREAARILAENKRVVIVDTSNEIAGDGDIPHPAIGRARRMQVRTPSQQHEVMIEAVENHNPEVIVIDEIGREQEAQAARTIAERGVQLIGTAHGRTLENLINNPTISDLVGGVESVTLSDEEARRRGTHKAGRARRAPPTFDVAIEIEAWYRYALHHDVAAAVDSLLRGRPLTAEVRYRDDEGGVQVEAGSEPPPPRTAERGREARDSRPASGTIDRRRNGRRDKASSKAGAAMAPRSLRVFAYGVSQDRLRRSARALEVPLVLVDELADADALITLKSYYRKRPVVINDAETRRVPVYVLRSNTYAQVENVLVDLFGLQSASDPRETAIDEARDAIRTIRSGERTMVELGPQNAFLRRKQHELARDAEMLSLSRGRDPNRRVRVYRPE